MTICDFSSGPLASESWLLFICNMRGLGLGGRGLALNSRFFLVVRRYLPIECTLGALIQVCGCSIVARARAERQVSRPRAGKQHVPLSLLKSHAQRAMEVILKNYVDRAAVQSKALTKEAPLVMRHACDKINERLMLHGIGFSPDIPEWVANDFFMSTDASMASGHGKEINLRAYCISTMCGVYGASVRWTSTELRKCRTAASTVRSLAQGDSGQRQGQRSSRVH
ncbi:hypothetical protein Syun_030802 [Stephania yunnanensis]|uniref:Uncharacterized protein n=1 Tax=Stephania yunnanensis TaxID=152371 RepID=A0AAP0HAV9_9MAGN